MSIVCTLLLFTGVYFPPFFYSIPLNSNPKDRMVAIVRYYLSSFHAARKGTVAKKPYNPILGETFKCYWDLPESSRASPSDEAKVSGCGSEWVWLLGTMVTSSACIFSLM